jgi:hypothetical protein
MISLLGRSSGSLHTYNTERYHEALVNVTLKKAPKAKKMKAREKRLGEEYEWDK